VKLRYEDNQSLIGIDKPRSDIDEENYASAQNRIKIAKQKENKGFLTLGYGFVAYFSFMEFMIVLFTILTVLSAPSIYYYMTFRDTKGTKVGFLDHFSMGNLGYSSTLCRDVHLGVSKMTLS
jgi:hypothetical protein